MIKLTEKTWQRARLATAAVFGALLFWICWPVILKTMNAFRNPQYDLMHGWVIVPVAAVAAWTLRGKLRQAVGKPAPGGLLLLFLSFLFIWAGERGGQMRAGQFGFILAIPAFAWLCWGRNVAKILFFPCAYLVFIIPMNFLEFITLPLRIFSTMLAAGILNGLGIDVIREGSNLISATGRFHLDVVEPCSGIKSVFAIMALSAAYGFFYHRTFLRITLLMACSVPLAIIANIVRLITIGAVAHFFGQADAMHIYHELSGFITFPVAIVLMLVIGEELIPKIGRDPDDSKPVHPPARPRTWAVGAAVLALAIASAAAMQTALRTMPPLALEKDNFIAATLPRELDNLPGYNLWFCQAIDCMTTAREDHIAAWSNRVALCTVCRTPMDHISYFEKSLPADTRMLKRLYENQNRSITLNVVVSGTSRQSIHRPELCLPGQGYSITDRTIHHLVLDNGWPLEVMVVQARKIGAPPVGFAYFFTNGHIQTASHARRLFSDIVQRSFFGRINRWAMVTLIGTIPFETDEGIEKLRQLLSEAYPQVYTGPPPQ